MREIEISRISPNPAQPRLQIDEDSLAELAESIGEHGLLQPIVVTRAEGNGESYVLIAGERRWRAARLAGLETVPAVVKEAAPRQRLALALVENLQRADLSPLEMATAYRALIDEHGLTQEQVARQVGKSRVAVANTLRLLQLPRPGLEALAAGRISEGHARALLSAPNETGLLACLYEVLRLGLSVRQAEELVRRVVAAPTAEPGSPESGPARPDPETALLEERFRQALGTKVQLVRSRRGGRLIIHFFSDEELQGIYEAICEAKGSS